MTTIRDVAKVSGVSVATVSYVMNDGPRAVRPATRQRVLDAIRQLDFHPNAMARGLISHRLNTIGVLFGMVEPAILTNLYASSVLQGILTEAAALGFNVTIITAHWETADVSAALLQDGRVDGVLVVAPLLDSDIIPGLAATGIPVVAISAAGESAQIPAVDTDNEAGARLAAEHLIGLGHRRIAHIMGNENQPSVPPRRKGFRDALADAGICLPDEYLVSSCYNTEYADYDTQTLLGLPDRPTAVFAGNDGIALGVLSAARALGLSIPGDLSLVGFDDIPTASQVTPALTTVRQPLIEMGAQATDLLVALIKKSEAAPVTYRRVPELIVRASTAPPAFFHPSPNSKEQETLRTSRKELL